MLAILLASPARCAPRFLPRKIDRDLRDVAQVILEDIQRYVSDRLDDFTATQTDGTGAREICIREFTALNHYAPRES